MFYLGLFQDFRDGELAGSEMVIAIDIDVDFLGRIAIVIVRAFRFGVYILLKINFKPCLIIIFYTLYEERKWE